MSGGLDFDFFDYVQQDIEDGEEPSVWIDGWYWDVYKRENGLSSGVTAESPARGVHGWQWGGPTGTCDVLLKGMLGTRRS
jgi:hypothetical protein